MIEAIIIIGLLSVYATALSTINFLKNKKEGKITEDGVISPKGKELVKKKTR